MPAAGDAGKRRRIAWLLEMSLRRFRRVSNCDRLARASLVRHHPATDLVSAVGYAGTACPFLDSLSMPLSDLPGLDFGTQGGRLRIIHDIGRLGACDGRHVQALLQAGLRSSLTAALQGANDVEGFLFLNAAEPGLFTAELVTTLTGPLNECLVLLRHELNRV